MEKIPKAMTLPPELEFRPSSMETMQIGVWSKRAIKKDETYGPFLGEKKKLSDVHDNTYSWEIRGPKGRRLFCIDASDSSKGNWMRYVKSARFYEEQNMIAVQEDKNIFYKTLRKIPKDQELLCWYSGGHPPDRKTRMKPSSFVSKYKDSHIARTCNENANGSETCTGNGTLSSADHDDVSVKNETDNLQSTCINFSGLNDSITKMISSEPPGNSGRGKGPVVKLIPLSAEIKLKVHLDLDIHLDSDLKAEDTLSSDIKSPKTLISENVKAEFDESCQISFHQSSKTDSVIIAQTKIDKDHDLEGHLPKPSAIHLISQSKQDVKKEVSHFNKDLPDKFLCSQEKNQSQEKMNTDVQNFQSKVSLCEDSTHIDDQKTTEVKLQKCKETNEQNVLGNEIAAYVKEEISCPVSIVKKEIPCSLANVKKELPCPVSPLKHELICSVASVKNEASRTDEMVVKRLDDVVQTSGIINDVSKVEESESASKNESKQKSIMVDQHMLQRRTESDTISKKGNKHKFRNKKQKRTQYMCHMCNRGFRKPFHLKIHIIRAHEKRERKTKEYVVRKREKIRTRSVSYLDKAGQKSVHKSKEEIGADSPGDTEKSTPGRKFATTNIIHRQYKKILPKPQQHATPSNQDVFQNQTDKKVHEMHRCHECKRIFKYKSWLDRHMVIHQQSSRKLVWEDTLNIQSSLHPDVKQEIDVIDEDKSMERSYGVKSSADGDTTFAEKSSAKPFFCSYCGKNFTTKKNARRHKRLIHNILVRPERTKLPYFNYIVEKPHSTFTTNNGKYIQQKMRNSDKKPLKPGHETMPKIRKPNLKRGKSISHWAGRTTSSTGISVRLFDPSQIAMSGAKSSVTNLKRKIEWGISSNRTGPPPAAAGLRNDDLYRQMLDQEALFTGETPKTNPWAQTRKPSPFIPTKLTSKDRSTSFGNKFPTATSGSTPAIPLKQVTCSTSNSRVADMNANQPVDLSSRDKQKKHDTSVKNSAAIAISPACTKTQSTNSDYPRQTLVYGKIPSKEMVDLTELKLKRKCDQTYNAAQKHFKDGPLHLESAQRRMFSKQLNDEVSLVKSKQSSIILITPTSTDMKETGHGSHTSKSLDLQKQHVSTFRPILPKLGPTIKQPIRPSAEKPNHFKTERITKDPLLTVICNVCSMSFSTGEQLQHHVAHHADSWPYKCKFCIKLFKSPQELMLHRTTHLADKPFPCQTRTGRFEDEEKEHYADVHSTKKTQKGQRQDNGKMCVGSGDKYPLQVTQRTPVPNIVQTTTYRCTKCSKQFTETTEFHSHIIDCALTGVD